MSVPYWLRKSAASPSTDLAHVLLLVVLLLLLPPMQARRKHGPAVKAHHTMQSSKEAA
jgi:hypothetical protein